MKVWSLSLSAKTPKSQIFSPKPQFNGISGFYCIKDSADSNISCCYLAPSKIWNDDFY